MVGKTVLQQALLPEELGRNFHGMIDLFQHSGVSLQMELLNRMREGKPEIVIGDFGCGKCNAIEQAVRTAKVMANNIGYKGQIKGVGVDQNPLLEEIDPDILKFAGFSGVLSEIKQGDVCELPLESDSLDIFYSANTLQYADDALKALNEGYRVLAPGGIGVWDVLDDQVSVSPKLATLLLSTPGAEKVFQYHEEEVDGENLGFIICRKSLDDTFKGFDFELLEEGAVSVGGKVGRISKFIKQKLYRWRRDNLENVQ